MEGINWRCKLKKSTNLCLLSIISLFFVYQIGMTKPIELTALKRDIQDNYLSAGAKLIAERHNVALQTVYAYASNLGVTSNQRWEKEKDEIIRRYQAGEAIKSISREFGHFQGSTMRKLVGWGVQIRTPTESKAKYDYDTTFFAAIDTHEKAYWLGFIYADGNVYLSEDGYKHVFQVCLAAKDHGHLDKLKSALKDERPMYMDRGNQRYMINSIPFTKDLVALGVIPRKSLDMAFPAPDQVPHQFLNSFILGYFDGDGSISVQSKVWGFNMIGTWSFLTGCQDRLILSGLHKTKLSSEKRKGDGKLAYLSYGGTYYNDSDGKYAFRRKDALVKLYRYLYADSPVWLDRKRNLFETALTKMYGNDWKSIT